MESRRRYNSPAPGAASQDRLDLGGGILHHMQAGIGQGIAQEFDEIPVGLDRHQMRVGAHPSQDLLGDAPDARSVLDDDPGTLPVDGLEHLIDEKA